MNIKTNGPEWVVLGFALIASFCAVWLLNANHGLERQVASQASIIEEKNSEITYHKNGKNDEYAKRIAAEGDRKTLESFYGSQLSQIQKTLEINKRDIKGLYRVATSIQGSGQGKIDTIYVEKGGELVAVLDSIGVSDSTKWFKITGSVSRRSGFLYNYEATDSITLVPYDENGKTYVKAISANPNVRLTGLQAILVNENKKLKRFGIGPSIQIGYDTRLRITPGISVQYSLLKF